MLDLEDSYVHQSNFSARDEQAEICFRISVMIREREVGEIIPVNAEQSATKDNDNDDYGAGRAIDMDSSTSSHAVADSDGLIWIKIHLGQVYCIKQVVRYGDSVEPWQTWNCTHLGCDTCVGEQCGSFTLDVSTDEAEIVRFLPPFDHCIYGDNVMYKRTQGDKLKIKEMLIIKSQGRSEFRTDS